MRPAQFFAAVVMIGICLAVVSWVARRAPVTPLRPRGGFGQPQRENIPPPEPPKKGEEAPPEPDFFETNPLTISTEGPFPEVELPEFNYIFGKMALGDSGSHDFVIKNVGEAPLLLAKGPSQCKCTISGLGNTEVPPGGETTVNVKWTPTDAGPFGQITKIWTNDPAKPQITLGVAGELVPEVALQPSTGWPLGLLSPGTLVPLEGVVLSSVLDTLEVTELKTSSPDLKFEQVPLNEDQRKELGVKSAIGLRGLLTIPADAEARQLNEFVTIETNSARVPQFIVPVTATLSGPLMVLAKEWYDAERLLNLGRVSGETGRKTRLTFWIERGDEPLEFTNVQSYPDFLKVSLKPEQVGEGHKRERYIVTVEVPPGTPPGVWTRSTPGQIIIKTNHPKLKEIPMNVLLEVK